MPRRDWTAIVTLRHSRCCPGAVMESDRFDALTARLAAPLSRRRSVGVLGVLGLGSLLTADDTEARKHKKKKKKKQLTCGTGTRVCGRECIPNSSCCGSCPDGGFCRNGECVVCTGGETRCGNACVNLATDPDNCGKCGRVCPMGQCVHGACACNGDERCPSGCGCYSSATGGGACGGPTTTKPCVDLLCGLGEVCLARSHICTQTC